MKPSERIQEILDKFGVAPCPPESPIHDSYWKIMALIEYLDEQYEKDSSRGEKK